MSQKRTARKKTEHDDALDAFKLLDEYCRNHAKDNCEECVFSQAKQEDDEKATYGCGMIAGLEYAEKFSAICERARERAGELANGTD